jgi:hypothetical protein
MAKQLSVILLRGTLDNITFMKTKDGYIVRKKGGVNGDRIRFDDAYSRTRENNAEFGEASKAGQLFRAAFAPTVLNAKDSHVSARLTGLFQRIVATDTLHPRGSRTANGGDLRLLRDFNFNKDAYFVGSVKTHSQVVIDRTTGKVEIAIPAFRPTESIRSPQGATHCKFSAASALMDFTAHTYKADYSSSGFITLNNDQLDQQVFAHFIPPLSAAPIFVVLAITFWQDMNGTMWPLPNSACNAAQLVHLNLVDD